MCTFRFLWFRGRLAVAIMVVMVVAAAVRASSSKRRATVSSMAAALAIAATVSTGCTRVAIGFSKTRAVTTVRPAVRRLLEYECIAKVEWIHCVYCVASAHGTTTVEWIGWFTEYTKH